MKTNKFVLSTKLCMGLSVAFLLSCSKQVPLANQLFDNPNLQYFKKQKYNQLKMSDL